MNAKEYFKKVVSVIGKFELRPGEKRAIDNLIDDAKYTINKIVDELEVTNYSSAIKEYAGLSHIFAAIIGMLLGSSPEVAPAHKVFNEIEQIVRNYIVEKMTHKCLEN